MIVTHDLGLAWTIADRVAVMYLGRIVEVGPTQWVLTQPMHPYTRALLDVVPDAMQAPIERRLLAGEPPDPTRIPGGCGSIHGVLRSRTGRAAPAGVGGGVHGPTTPPAGRGEDGSTGRRATWRSAVARARVGYPAMVDTERPAFQTSQVASHRPRRRARHRRSRPGQAQDRGDDPQHRAAAPFHARRAPRGARAGRRGHHPRRARDRLHASCRREARRVPRRAPGPGAR